MQMVPSTLLLLAATFLLPESPRYLISIGKTAKARASLARVRHLSEEHEYISYEIDAIEDALEREKRSTGSKGYLALGKELAWKGNRNRVIIGVGLMIGQNLTGINGVNFYTPSIFKAVGFSGGNEILLASGKPSYCASRVDTLALLTGIQACTPWSRQSPQ